jgi:hypothetical protein
MSDGGLECFAAEVGPIERLYQERVTVSAKVSSWVLRKCVVARVAVDVVHVLRVATLQQWRPI